MKSLGYEYKNRIWWDELVPLDKVFLEICLNIFYNLIV